MSHAAAHVSSRFLQLCQALNERLTPALRAAGYVPPPEPFSRSSVRYEFKRATPTGTETVAVLFRRARPAEFSIQLFIEPIQGMQVLESEGGHLAIGTVSPVRYASPWSVMTFSAEPRFADRLLNRPARTAGQAVEAALALLPEVEAWWRTQGRTRHIRPGTLRYPGRRRPR